MRKTSSRLYHLICGIILVAVSLYVSGCGEKPVGIVDNKLASRCVMITSSTGDATGWQDWFNRHMASARRFPVQELLTAAEQCLETDSILILPGIEPLSGSATELVDQYLSRGGRLLTCGSAARMSIGTEEHHYTLTSGVMRVENAIGDVVEMPPRMMRSPYAKGNGSHDGSERFITVAHALDEDGTAIGHPGRVHLFPTKHDTYAVYGWLGMDSGPDKSQVLVPVMEHMLEVLSRDMYLLSCGVNQHSAHAETPLTARTSWIDLREKDLSPIRFSVEWLNSRDIPVKRVISAPLDPLSTPVTLNIGLTPGINGRSEDYTLRFAIHDRNDQRTFDASDQPFKIMSRQEAAPAAEYISVNAGQLVRRRRPLFMLGVNYWPRNAVTLASEGKHWLDTRYFDPGVAAADLDMMIAVGINTITMEYTTIDHAPQVRYMLDELRHRGMWACLYIPALHPLDLKIDEAERMLEALNLETWPEVFAVETARGLPVKKRSELRLLDPAWSNWIYEHFNSPLEAEQKLGITLWKERGRLSGPDDLALSEGPHRDRAIALYYAFLKDYVSRRMGYTRRWLNEKGYHTLMTARSRYGWPGDAPEAAVDYLDISTGALHQDILFPDAWTAHPLRTMYADHTLLAAYAHGISGGKPVVWSEYGQYISPGSSGADQQRQKEVYSHYLNAFVEAGTDGAFAWWFPPGTNSGLTEDWGVVNPQGDWRPVENVFRSFRYSLRQARTKARTPARKSAPVIRSARHWREEQANRTGIFAEDQPANINEWMLPGYGFSSANLLQPDNAQPWGEFDAFTLLNAEWTEINVDGTLYDRKPDTSVRVHVGQTLNMTLMNTGSIRWEKAANRKNGSVWVRISQSGSADVWLSSASLERGGSHTFSWIPRDTGLWEVQVYLIGYGRFGERMRVEVTTPPQLF